MSPLSCLPLKMPGYMIPIQAELSGKGYAGAQVFLYYERLKIYRIILTYAPIQLGVAMNYKNTQKGLKGPDLFQAKAFQYVEWIRKNQKTVVLIVAPLFAALFIGLGFQVVQNDRRIARQEALGAIDTLVAQSEEKAQKERDNLEKELATMEGTKSKDGAPQEAMKPAASPEEIAAKKKQLEDITADHTEALKQYDAFYKANPSTPEGWRAGLSVVQDHLKAKKFIEAQAIVKSILVASTSVPFYQQHVRLLSISILEELKLFDEALSECEALLSISDEGLKPQALLVKGRVLLLASKKEEASKTFDDLLTRYNSSPEAQKARSYKAVL